MELVCSDNGHHCSYYCSPSCTIGKGGGGGGGVVVGKGGGYGYGYGGYGYGKGGGGGGYYHGHDDDDDDDDGDGGYDDDSGGGGADDDDDGEGYYPPYDGGEPPTEDEEDEDADGGGDGAFTNEDEPYTWEVVPEGDGEGDGLIRENAEGCSAIAANGGVAPDSLPRQAFDLGMKVTIESNGGDPWATIAAIESYLHTVVAPSLSTCLAGSRQAPADDGTGAVAAAAAAAAGGSANEEQRQQQQASTSTATTGSAAAAATTSTSSSHAAASSTTKTHQATVATTTWSTSSSSTTSSTTSAVDDKAAASTSSSTTSSSSTAASAVDGAAVATGSTSSSTASSSSTTTSAVDEAAASILKVDFTVGRSNTPFCNASEPVAPGESCESLLIETIVVHEASFDSAANPGAMEQAVMNAISCVPDIEELPGVITTHEPCPFVISGGGSGVTEDGTIIGTGPGGRDPLADGIDKDAPLPDAIVDESQVNDDDGMVAGVIIAILVACITILVLLLLFVRRSIQYRANKRRLGNGDGNLEGGYYYDENGSLRNIHVVGDGDSAFGSGLSGYTSVAQRNASQQELNRMGLRSKDYVGRRPGDADDDAEALENAYMNQDVHVCTSATCRVCVGQQGSSRSVTFLRSTLPGDESTLTTNPASEKSQASSSRASQQRRGLASNVHDSVSL
jgi:hypothetical protein